MNINELKLTALKVREHIIRMSAKGGCFIGASLSCTDLIVYLYKEFLSVKILKDLKDEKRDYFLLSKGHDVPALYGCFAELGIIPKKRLENHLSVNDTIYWHPNVNIPGVEFHSGSLGHLLSIAGGIAYDCKIKGLKNKIVVMLGDGELQEGSIWEALLVINAYKLDNLLIIVDKNNFQANLKTEDLIPLEPLKKKFESFGLAVKEVNGHDFKNIDKVFKSFPFKKNKASLVIAETVRGKGLKSLESRADRWFVKFSEIEVEELLKELNGIKQAELTSEKLIVR